MKIFFLKIVPVLILAALIFGASSYANDKWFGIPNNSPKGEYQVEVKNGESLNDIAVDLAQNQIINDADWFWLVSKATVAPNVRAGTYKLDLPASKEEILKQLQKQVPAALSGATSISFLEGDTAEDVADKLDKSGIIKTGDFLSYIQNPENFKTSSYDFLPPVKAECEYGNILKNCPKYYLEGYLFPDTYEFFLESPADKVTAKFLNNFQKKIFDKHKSKLSAENPQADLLQKITLASVVEREVGRNYIKALINDTDLQKERVEVAGVFLNRTNQKIKWQSDATVWYGVDRKKGVAIDGALNWGDPKYKTGYNTYVISSAPIGPMANPGLDSIQAALEPANSSNLFFVSDRSGKMYFGKTNDEHENNKTKVREVNKSLPSL